jgi:signal transduction histidine kinase
MIAEMTQAPGLNILQLEVLPESLTANDILSGSVPAGNYASGRCADKTKQERLTQELKEITTLYNIGVAVGSSLNLDEVIWTLYKESGRLLDTSNFAIVIHEAQTDTLNFALIFDQGRRCRPRSLKRTDNLGLVGRVLADQTPLLVNDLSENNPVELSSMSVGSRLRSWLGIPIFNPVLPGEGIQGVIATWSSEPKAFTDHELWLLSAIGTQAAIALRNARLYESVLAERDRVIAAQEEARRALAHELHDGPTQLVSAISMRLDFCQMLLDKDPTQLAPEIAALKELTRQAIHQIRTLLFELRPLALERQGLQSAVELFLERRQEDVGSQPRLTLAVETAHPSGEISRQDEKVEAALFAIVQETINNALKHAQARHIVVHLKETTTTLYVTVADDGHGFDVAAVMGRYEQRGSLGMVNIQERADLIGAELRLESTPGRGTRVIVRVPKSEADRLRKRGSTGPLRLR